MAVEELSPFQTKIYKVLEKTKPGDVLTYSEVAHEINQPTAARAVGTAMGLIGSKVTIPWWRVVTSSGGLVKGNEAKQAKLLKADGVKLPLELK